MEILDPASWGGDGFICLGCGRAWTEIDECSKHTQECEKAKLIGLESEEDAGKSL